MRFQLALNVRNLEESIQYYSKLFNAQPHKVKTGYANFTLTNPSLKLVLIENENATEQINHLGVEVDQNENLSGIIDRLDEMKMTDRKEEQTTCCYATQDKAWSAAPDGIQWEWYTITDDNPNDAQPLHNGICCAPDSNVSNCC